MLNTAIACLKTFLIDSLTKGSSTSLSTTTVEISYEERNRQLEASLVLSEIAVINGVRMLPQWICCENDRGEQCWIEAECLLLSRLFSDLIQSYQLHITDEDLTQVEKEDQSFSIEKYRFPSIFNISDIDIIAMAKFGDWAKAHLTCPNPRPEKCQISMRTKPFKLSEFEKTFFASVDTPILLELIHIGDFLMAPSLHLYCCQEASIRMTQKSPLGEPEAIDMDRVRQEYNIENDMTDELVAYVNEKIRQLQQSSID